MGKRRQRQLSLAGGSRDPSSDPLTLERALGATPLRLHTETLNDSNSNNNHRLPRSAYAEPGTCKTLFRAGLTELMQRLSEEACLINAAPLLLQPGITEGK